MAKRKRSDNTFTITSYQPNDCVTSSSIMVEVDGLKILLDLGLMQDSSMTFPQLYHNNMQKLQSIPYEDLDYVIVSHFHYDHIASLPILAREETDFHGTIIATELTAKLGELIMYDAQRINQSEVAIHNNKTDKKKKYRTFYDKEDVSSVVEQIRCCGYCEKIRLSDNVTLELLPACHASGASMIYITCQDEFKTKRLLYTGDITYGHTVDRPFTKNILDKCLKVDVLLCESTYGLRDKATFENENPLDFMEKVILEEVVRKNQTLWCPSFALHRATTLYLYLYEIFQRNEEIRKANIPVFFCGQMMMEAHRIIGKDIYNEYYDEKWHNKKDIFIKEPFGFLTQKKDVEHFCLNNTRKIVVSSSGMADKGYSSLLSESYVANKKVSTIFCGYQGNGTLGSKIREGVEYASVNGISKKVKLNYRGTIPELSGHANHEGLLAFVKSLNQSVLKNVVLVHGDDVSKVELKEDLENVLSKNKNIHIIKQFESLKF